MQSVEEIVEAMANPRNGQHDETYEYAKGWSSSVLSKQSVSINDLSFRERMDIYIWKEINDYLPPCYLLCSTACAEPQARLPSGAV